MVTYHLHKIRKQRSREFYLPVRKPDQLFNYPGEGVENFSQPADPDLLTELKKEVEDFDHEIYQTSEVEKFCSETLSQGSMQFSWEDLLIDKTPVKVLELWSKISNPYI